MFDESELPAFAALSLSFLICKPKTVGEVLRSAAWESGDLGSGPACAPPPCVTLDSGASPRASGTFSRRGSSSVGVAKPHSRACLAPGGGASSTEPAVTPPACQLPFPDPWGAQRPLLMLKSDPLS